MEEREESPMTTDPTPLASRWVKDGPYSWRLSHEGRHYVVEKEDEREWYVYVARGQEPPAPGPAWRRIEVWYSSKADAQFAAEEMCEDAP